MVSQDTRESLLAAAAEVFVDQGFSGARVDAIARKAGVNKALIYYHYGSKQGLYRAMLLDLFRAPLGLLEALRRDEPDPRRRLERFYGSLPRLFTEKPGLPHIMLREILAGGTHIDEEALRALSALLLFVVETVEQGKATGRIRAVDPLFVHLAMIGPLMLFAVSHRFRARLLPVAAPGRSAPTAGAFEGQLQDLLSRLLAAGPDPSTPDNRTGAAS
jgi:TetR/AcrR family transcriptional regulator